MAKTLRRGKVFIDWSQNSDFKTTIGVYALRAKSDEPFVSMPVTWDELEDLQRDGDTPDLRFRPDDALKRAEAQGDLFAPLLTLRQTLPKQLTGPAAKKVSSNVVSSTTPAKNDSNHDKDLVSLPKARAEFIPPMLLVRTERLPEGASWLYELKLDGYRAIAVKSKGKVQLWSRNENDFGRRYPQIAAALASLPDDTVVDGEIVALDDAGKPSFNALQNYGSAETPLLYYLFDVPILKGHDLRGQTLEQRRAKLETSVLRFLTEPIRPSPVLPGNLNDLSQAVYVFRWQLTNAADKVDGYTFPADTEDNALGFCVSCNQPILLFFDGDNFGWFWDAHSIG
jgi:bifunctional non-homologous end joining protein LigD